MINSGLRDFKEEIEDMSEQEKKPRKPKWNSWYWWKIIEFNRQQRGQGLKKLTPSQMLGRLPISLALLKAGNSSEKLKNEIRHLLYFLYRSKKFTKQLYKNEVDIIWIWKQVLWTAKTVKQVSLTDLNWI